MPRIVYDSPEIVASGPYSNAVDAGELVYFAGQTAMNSEAGVAYADDIQKQTAQCFKNLLALLKAAGLSESDVVKVNVYLTDMENFSEMNEEYKKYFSAPYPARTCIAVLGLPLGAEVEIEMIARKAKSN
ncbi:RidA family protein [Pragia fontium]|uniref:2-iminobutanoate/2-iminopropanoate deaminase n=2 Tax=Pragia fontium TaxID=82985 RepID=A0AAJ4WBC0_9GAMM|nr:Rid family detoxifying hydrolase [Pragia fontium]AKJ42166.1 endoribonuclease L-PSP [Pragia fontium]SFC98907.1 2-iminobutanoate/2-iminopropanoate deaminase [Pragia fontium DSM 5563 = ATCC 49100]SUB82425.1 Enamine/imine deaminase [Pragia fontium]VEJ55327.1 Enamine/imine deaminase [Pragia fontium]GKX61777.1 reactive intermediate/imine deaminase [Pragia fontium]